MPEPIPGLAFFPGGYGLWGSREGQPLPRFPVGGIMVLGHDFHSREGYEKSRNLGGEPLTMPTWSNLTTLLRKVGVAPERCFFTNFFMGLRTGAATTGLFPGAADDNFVAHCRAFLIEQLRIQRPALILTLGVHVPKMIGPLSPKLAPWADGEGLKHLDAVGAVHTGVTFAGVADYSASVVALIHPSLRHASLRHRRYGVIRGAEAELAMLRAGLASAGVAAG